MRGKMKKKKSLQKYVLCDVLMTIVLRTRNKSFIILSQIPLINCN